jgi:hypothetical protein
MNRHTRMAFGLALLSCLVLTGAILAAPAATTLDRWVMAGGGGRTAAAAYSLDGMIGQPVVGGVGNDPYELGAGFWGGLGAVASRGHSIYLPIVLQQYAP